MDILQLIVDVLLAIASALAFICVLTWLGMVCAYVRRSHEERSHNPRSTGRTALSAKIATGSFDIASLWFSEGRKPRQTDPLLPSRYSVPIINPATGFPMINGMGGVDMTGSPFGFDVRAPFNPANGLPMINGMNGVDVAGNPYGTDMSKFHGFGHDGFP